MTSRKEDEIMAECLLKGGKMLEKSCKTCGCPLFEVKGKTLCIVCAENENAKKAAAPVAHAHAGHEHGCGCGEEHGTHHHEHDDECGCGVDHDEDTCTCGDEEGGLLAEEIAMTIHALCERIHNEKDPENVLALMQAVKAGTESLEILCRL
ncbi:Sjogren's syndrome/scleroderma autoantigen 1 family protein [Methanoregula sp.]|uniref:Sjogren's syndrome/scleroderma autoantigen 1 family protein n=1 Tax=Methanoregula sp. TaxID=2052170 RepID=UPI00236DAA46|nr:Sjogren's syndrome/scleroderma autoantigen 1 family protein [Methanoregula sp.]MDD1685837.1 hypothetical protein [Methanoregula sp.]